MSGHREAGRRGGNRTADRMGWRRGAEKAKVVSVAVYPDELAWLREQATGMRMSLSQLLRVLLRRQMRRHEEEA